MQKLARGSSRIILVAALLVAVIAVAVAFRNWKQRHASDTTPPAVSTTTTQPAHAAPPAKTRPAAEVSRDSAYLDVIHSAYPEFATTQPLAAPLELSQAAHLHLHVPIYLGGLGRMEMWMTRPDAPPLDAVLKDAVDENKDLDVHVLRQRPVFVHWMPSENAVWPPYLVCPTNGGYEVISEAYGHQPLPGHGDYHWQNAMSWNDKVIVPTTHGISVFRFGPQIAESHHGLLGPGAKPQPGEVYSEPRFLLDADGLLAWLPWETGKVGGLGAVQYVEPPADETTGKIPPPVWTDLTPDNGWPPKLLHLVPLLDGTVLMLVVDDHGAVQVQFNTMEHINVKEEEIDKLVDDLSDTDQAVRNAAYDKLSQYGSGIWPILEKLLPTEGPEAQARMRQLLKQKVVPTLNGMVLLGNKTLNLAARLADGGTVFYAEAGVSIPDPDNPDAEPGYRVPAWIGIRPGRPIELLPESLTSDLTVGQSKLYANGNDWIVTNDIRGPRRFVGNGYVTLLRKSEHDFSDFVGVDRRGRWLFRKPAGVNATTAPSATEPAASSLPAPGKASTVPSAANDETLIIDPMLPDPTPRLPVWVLDTADEVGWTKEGWPVTKKNSAYALHENGWQLLNESDEIFGKPEDVPPQVEPPLPNSPAATMPTSGPATFPTTAVEGYPTTAPAIAATIPATQTGESPILTDRQGTRYFGGLTDLRLVPRKGPTITYALPVVATGVGPPWLVRIADGRLFLFNQPGRVVCLKPTPGKAEPFKLEQIFTHHVPTVKTPTRIWVDPAGRIAMAWENQLAIFFPDGYIAPPIAELMLGANDEMDE